MMSCHQTSTTDELLDSFKYCVPVYQTTRINDMHIAAQCTIKPIFYCISDDMECSVISYTNVATSSITNMKVCMYSSKSGLRLNALLLVRAPYNFVRRA